ncbi:MAG TPA: hypothetical protein VGK27_09195 [Candidatus Deferrimicrobiaceae bacterium]|jgi:hypothetical protein
MMRAGWIAAGLALLLCCAALPAAAETGAAHEKEAKQAEALAAKIAGETPPGTGFEGRVVRDGEIVQDARVYAYKSFDDLVACKPAAVSGPTADDGSWKIDLPRGKYYLAVKKRKAGKEDGPLSPGDFFAFQGSNPITVAPGKYTHVGFSVVALDEGVTYEKGADSGTGTLKGVVSLGGKPAEGVSVILYLDGKNDFRGVGYSSTPPTRKDGQFRIDMLPEADYFVIARKRATGKSAGPLTDGDAFGYYIVNPVHVKAGQSATIKLGVIAKAGEIGKEDSLFRDTGTYISGHILDKDGKPVKGVYAFAYTERAMAHQRPDHISKPVDAEGRFVIYLPQGGTYYIGARSDYGDTPGYGEWYGRYEGTGDHSVKVETGKVRDKVDMAVEQILK